MEKDLVLTIDFGTQSVRVSIIDRFGKFLAFEQAKYEKPYFSIKPGYCEQNPSFYYDKLCIASKKLASEHKDLLDRCMAMSLTCFRDTPVFLDENYNIVRPSIIWLDQRQAKLERKIPKLYNLIFDVVGMKEAIILNRKRTPALWIQENEPENWKKTKYYVPLSSYLNYRLIGVLGDGPSNMVGHFPINFKKKKWYSKNALKGCIFGIEPKKTPKLFKTGEIIGKITPQAHYETGLPEGLIFITTGNDKACEALGCGAINGKIGHISYGTASTVSLVSKKYFNPEPFLPAYPGCYEGVYNKEVQIYRGYWMLSWFSKEFAIYESVEAEIEKMSVEEVLNKKLMDIPPGSNGLIVQPYWGPGLRRPLAKGAIIGFYDVHTKEHVYRAIIEGIAYALKEGLDGMIKKSRENIDFLVISGGGSKSDAICQITADIFNLPVKKPENYEASSLGCAIALYKALGIYKTIEDATKNMVKLTKQFTPNKEASKKYAYLFNNVYLKIYPALSKSYKNLTEYLQINNEGSVR